jgi:nucleotidyltransferase/DNA polymerase involved in DNA repair
MWRIRAFEEKACNAAARRHGLHEGMPARDAVSRMLEAD